MAKHVDNEINNYLMIGFGVVIFGGLAYYYLAGRKEEADDIEPERVEQPLVRHTDLFEVNNIKEG